MSVIRDILDDAGAAVIDGTGGELRVCCPFCQENGLTPDDKHHLGVNVVTCEAHCFRCDWKGKGSMYIARSLCRAFKIKFNINVRRKVKAQKPEPEKPAAQEIEKQVLAGLPEEYETFQCLDAVGHKVLAYLKGRGVSTLQIVKHRIGYAGAGPMSWRALFPVLDAEGKVHGCVGRTIRSDITPKYLNTKGMKILWNAVRAHSTAVVVEGVMDALRLETALLHFRGMVPVARLGAAITGAQLDQLTQYEKVIVLPDHDRAGVTGAIELCGRCCDRGIRVLVNVPERMTGLDPDSMSEDQIADAVSGAAVWSAGIERRLRLAMTKYASGEFD